MFDFFKKNNQLPDIYTIQLEPGDIVIDCGANIGKVTEKLYIKGTEFYCFEPNPYAYEKLKNKFINKLNVNCYQNGVWINNCEKKLYFHEHSNKDEIHWSTGSSYLEYKGNINKNKFIKTQLVDLNEFIVSLKKKVRILKLDIEGLECPILMKLINKETYKNIDYIFVETHEKKIPQLLEETKLLTSTIKEKNITNIDLNWI
tara:strand:+ start:761 stop:1366 length:606 start_codon:yes stop_codon:yes gene_type:complete